MSSGLLGLYNLGSNAIDAAQAGIAITGNNTANVNTDGYSLESVDFISQQHGGVLAGNAYRQADSILAGRERASAGSQGRTATLSTALSSLEQTLTAHGPDLVNAIANLFGGFVQLASAPTDPALRTAAIQGATNLATTFQQSYATIAQSRVDSDNRIISLAQQATELAQQIATANKALAGNNDPTLSDARDTAAKKLAGLVGGQALLDSNGKMHFVAAGGEVLVDGDRAAKITTSNDPANDGHVKVTVVDGAHVADVTNKLDGGSIAGEVAFRDGTAKQALAQLDQLAYDLASNVNAVHAQNAGLDGVTGRDLFAQPTQVAGAAASFSVSAGILADPATLATAGAGAGKTDNTGVNALVALNDQTLAGGGANTFVNESIATIGNIGSATQVATSENDTENAKAGVLASARTSVSGVSTSEELAKLASYQRAAQSAGNYVTSVSAMLDYLLSHLV